MTPDTGSSTLNSIISQNQFQYSAVKYPSSLSCLSDCGFLTLLNGPGAFDAIFLALNQRSNIDAFIVEICIIYFELNRIDPTVSTCFPKPLRRHAEKGRLIGNSLTNSYRIASELENTLRQYPWACSLRWVILGVTHCCPQDPRLPGPACLRCHPPLGASSEDRAGGRRTL